MPTLPPRPCRHPACPALVTDGSGYCAAHASDKAASRRQYDQTTRKDEPERAFAAQLRSTARWRKTSKLVRAQNPLCCDPYGDHARDGLPAYSAQVHHIVSLEVIHANGNHEQAFDLSNLAAVCTTCHARLEASERKGHATAFLFDGKAALPPTQWFA